MKSKISNKSGFTLIELLVVISIISLLSSVILASLNSARNKAYEAKTASERHSLEVAVQLFYNDHNAYPYPGGAANDLYCLATTDCLYGGVVYHPSSDGELATIIDNKTLPLASRFSVPFINKAYAFLGGKLPSQLSRSPLVTIGGLSYAGPFYSCVAVNGTKCTNAVVIWTTKDSSCPIGQVKSSLSSSGGTVCQNNAIGSASSLPLY